MRDQSSFDLYKLLFIAGNVTAEGNVNSNSELSGTVSVSFTAPGLFVVASPVQFVELIDTVIIFAGSEPVEPFLLFNLCVLMLIVLLRTRA